MEATRRILLYGNSLILGTVGASLRRSSGFEVTLLAPPQALDGVEADIILFDLETPRTEAVFSCLERNPTLVLIGLSPGTNLVRVWSGRQMKDLSMQGLLELIKLTVIARPVDPGGDGKTSWSKR